MAGVPWPPPTTWRLSPLVGRNQWKVRDMGGLRSGSFVSGAFVSGQVVAGSFVSGQIWSGSFVTAGRAGAA
ncbi:hypothetical protein GCM10022233_35560 [Streptomyces shaanxiensis]|uniref:Uncharacterized protein n=1 Tax=Streptomyces shaanxiensis TaxID=653357 RepID=A0ABP7V589_9ACTN